MSAPAEDQAESLKPALPAVLPLPEQAALRNAWLAEPLDTLVPALMRANGVDM